MRDTNTAPEPALHPDTPLENPEDDRLGHAPFAKAVATSILGIKGTDGFVFAVNGPWGSGKTTAVNFIAHHLRDAELEDDLKIVRFHPWWFSGQEDLLRHFFDELLAVIGKDIGEEATGAIKSFVRKLSGAEAGLKLAMSVVPVIKDIPDEWKEGIAEAAGIAGEGAKAGQSITALKKVMAETLEKKDFRTVVIIDDIDRLTSDEQLQIFKLVKSVADLPKITYVLVFDQRLADQALADRPEFRDGAYLEKIVQAPFDVPTPGPHRLDHWFGEQLNRVIDNAEPNEQDRWYTGYRDIVRPYLSTPRAVMKLVNALYVAWPVIGEEVDLTDFLVVEALRLFDRPVFDLIRFEREWLTGRYFNDGNAQSEQAEKIMAALSHENRARAKRILAFLFPRFAAASQSLQESSPRLDHLAHHRLCTEEFFPLYFEFGLTDGAYGAADFIAFDRAIDEGAVPAYFATLTSTERLPVGTKANSLLEALEAKADTLSKDPAVRYLLALLSHGDDLLADANCRDTFSFGGADRMLQPVMKRLMTKVHKEGGRPSDQVKVSLSKPSGLEAQGLAITSLGWSIGRFLNKGEAPQGPALVTGDELDALITAWGAKMKAATEDGAVYELHFPLRSLFRYADFSGDEAVSAWLTRDWSKQDQKQSVLKLFTGWGVVSNSDGTRRYPSVFRNEVDRFLPAAELEVEARRLFSDPTAPEEQQEIARHFLDGLEEGSQRGGG